MSTETPSNARIEKEHIVMTPGTCGGKPRIAGTRIKVQHVAVMYEGMGQSIDEIIEAYPHLNLADVHAALTYFYDHVDEIRQHIREDVEIAEEYRRKHGPGPLETKLRQQGRWKDDFSS